MAPGYYSTQQAAQQIGITRQALHQWIEKGFITPPRLTVGRALAWTAEEIARAQAQRKGVKPGKPGRPRKAKGANRQGKRARG